MTDLRRLIILLIVGVTVFPACVAAQPLRLCFPGLSCSLAPSSSVDTTNGNLLVNGQAFLPISGDSEGVTNFHGAGYTFAQDQAKFAQMQAAGYNLMFENWATLGSQYPLQVPPQWFSLYTGQFYFQQYGMYFWGGNTLDDLSPGGAFAVPWVTPHEPIPYPKQVSDPTQPNSMARIVNRFVGRTDLLIWWTANEYQNFSEPFPARTGVVDTTLGPSTTTSCYLQGIHGLTDVIVNGAFAPVSASNPLTVITSGHTSVSYTITQVIPDGTNRSTNGGWSGQIIFNTASAPPANGDILVADVNFQPSPQDEPYAIARLNSRSLDSSRVTGDVYVGGGNSQVQLNAMLDGQGTAPVIMWAEQVFDGNMSGTYTGPSSVQSTIIQSGAAGAGGKLVSLIRNMGLPSTNVNSANLNDAWTNGGKRFVLGVSTTPIAEIGNNQSSNITFTFSSDDPVAMHRYFMLQAAANVHAFDILWGGNQRGSGWPGGDINASYTNVWNETLAEIKILSGVTVLETGDKLRDIILAPGRWTLLTTGPTPFQVNVPPANNSIQGIYAASKNYHGKTYVIAVNMNTAENLNTGMIFGEYALSSASGAQNATVTINGNGSGGVMAQGVFKNSGTPAHVQTVYNDNFYTAAGTEKTLTGTLPSAVTTGDLLVGFFRANDSANTISVSDNVNGAWTKAASAYTNDGTASYGIFYVANTASAGANGLTVTATSTTAGPMRLIIEEFSGIATSSPFDQGSITTNQPATAWAAGTTASVSAGELVWAAGTADGGNFSGFTAGTTNGVAMVFTAPSGPLYQGGKFIDYGRYVESAQTGSTITLGSTVSSCTRLLQNYLQEGSGSVSLSGGNTIHDDFAIMQVHMYACQ